jgi:hypothetical protein
MFVIHIKLSVEVMGRMLLMCCSRYRYLHLGEFVVRLLYFRVQLANGTSILVHCRYPNHDTQHWKHSETFYCSHFREDSLNKLTVSVNRF